MYVCMQIGLQNALSWNPWCAGYSDW